MRFARVLKCASAHKTKMRVKNFSFFAREHTKMRAAEGENARQDTKMRAWPGENARPRTKMRAEQIKRENARKTQNFCIKRTAILNARKIKIYIKSNYYLKIK